MAPNSDKSPGRIHIIGAGVAGLSAAVRLAERGHRVALYEAGPQAGGRCRSYFDETLGCRIDNGNHLLLSGNRSVMRYLRTVGAADTLTGPVEARYPFMDLTTGERWVLRPSQGRLPLWLLDPARRVPGTRAADYLAAWRLLAADADATIADCFGPGTTLYRRFWHPLSVAVLNTEADTAAAALMRPVLLETFGRGGAACRPLVAATGLSESFVDPALAWLTLRGGRLFTGMRARALSVEAGRVTQIAFADGQSVPVESDDAVVLATPPAAATGLLPGLVVPTEFRAIVNAHFRLAETAPGPVEPGPVEILGLIGGAAEWIFRRGALASVTVSAATAMVDQPAETLGALLWADVARALNLAADPPPPMRIVKEKRATFAQTVAQVRRRPKTRTDLRNLMLAGDWTDTGLPATLEGAIRSGEAAASALGA